MKKKLILYFCFSLFHFFSFSLLFSSNLSFIKWQQPLVLRLILFVFVHQCCNPASQFLLNVETKQMFCLCWASFPVIWSALRPPLWFSARPFLVYTQSISHPKPWQLWQRMRTESMSWLSELSIWDNSLSPLSIPQTDPASGIPPWTSMVIFIIKQRYGKNSYWEISFLGKSLFFCFSN